MPEVERYEHGRFCWVDFSAADMDRAAAWFSELFGWDVEHQDTHGGPPYAQFTLGGKVVAGVGQLSPEMKAAGVPPVWNNYVGVDDAAAIAKRVVELEGTVVVPVMKVMGAGSLAYFNDPEGANFAVWQAGEHHGAEVVNELNTWSWTELNSWDVERAAGFYGALFGWSFVDAPGAHAYKVARAGNEDRAGMLQIDPSWGKMPPVWGTYFRVEDCDATCKRIEATGGTIRVPPTTLPTGRFAVVTEPDGGTFTIIQRPSENP